MSDNTVEIAIRLALDQFRQSVDQLQQSFGTAMSSMETEAAVAGGALEEAFKVLGAPAVASVEAEVQKLQTAIGLIRTMPGVLPADAERATQAFNQRLAELRDKANGVPPAVDRMTGSVNQTAQALGNAAHKAVAWAGGPGRRASCRAARSCRWRKPACPCGTCWRARRARTSRNCND